MALDIRIFIGIAFSKNDPIWLNVFLLSDYATPYIIEQAIENVVIMKHTNLEMIENLFVSHEYLSKKTCESHQSHQDNVLFAACFDNRIDLVTRIIKKFKSITPAMLDKCREMAHTQCNDELREILGGSHSKDKI
jgi:hypothetical protein